MPRYLYDLLRHNMREARRRGDTATANRIRDIQIPAYAACRRLRKASLCHHEPNCATGLAPKCHCPTCSPRQASQRKAAKAA